MMKIISLLLACSTIVCSSFAQNLVPNPSFENNTMCPWGLATFSPLDNWQIGLWGGSPDYFHTCSTSANADVPNNLFGTQAANTGNAYVGISNKGNANYRELFEVALISPLIAGEEYCVSLWVSNSEWSTIISDNSLGIGLTPASLISTGPVVGVVTPQLQSNVLIDDKVNWMQLTFTYTATGGESIMTIGNFNDDAATNTIVDPTGTGPANRGYLYIDDVEVRRIEDDPTFVAPAPLCTSDASTNLTAVDGGGTWTGTGITDATNGTFDPSVAGAGTHTITYTIPGTCPQIHSEDITVTDCSLPVELLNFNAVADGPDRVQVSWTTVTEVDNDYFVIERSPDAINFSSIQTVDGAGNTTQQQNYIDYDNDPYRGINYYRLRQVDFDGTTDYSDIQSVVFDDLTFVNLFPNPSDGEVEMTIMVDKPSDLYVQIIDAMGRSVMEEQFDVVEGKSTIKMNVEVLSSGVYTFRINTTDENHLSKEFIRN